MSDDIQEAKRRVPLPVLMHRLGLGQHAKKRAFCPFHDDQHTSFSVYRDNKGEFRFKCFAGCGGGDEIDFVALAERLSKADAIRRFKELAGVKNDSASCKPFVAGRAVEQRKEAKPNDSPTATPQTFDWQECVQSFTDKDALRLQLQRGYSRAFCRWLKENGHIGKYNGCIAFPLHDRAGNVVAVHYRLKDGSWRYYPQGTKARPLVIGELVAGEPVHVFESQWDAFAFMDISGERCGVVITRGASNAALVAGMIPENSTAYAWTQNDAAGEKWQGDICGNTRAVVKRARIPKSHKDLNDWTRALAGAATDDLVAAMANAEVIQQAEKTWLDALNESVVTSSELRDLHLTPRKKLLGDWFCEGDLGFIFAFRGVGKTWFGLGLAQALSTGSWLGEWQAHEPVKMLYVDGEMPPDLMRDRFDGLLASNSKLEFLNHEILFERTCKVLNIASRDIQDAITKRCINTGVKVLILDNLSTLASGMKENEADSWEKVNPWLLDLRRRKIAVIIIHHAGRSGEMRGTSKREDNVFWIIALDDAKKNADDKRGARFV